MKFRLLNDNELQHFEEDFKHFLIINGVSNEEWISINQHEKDKAVELVSLFSDLILQRVYEKVNYLEYRSKNQLFIFKCDADEIHLTSLKSEDSSVDFSNPTLIHESIIHHSDKISYFTQTKSYQNDREIELFKMVEQGCIISTQDFYDALQNALKNE